MDGHQNGMDSCQDGQYGQYDNPDGYWFLFVYFDQVFNAWLTLLEEFGLSISKDILFEISPMFKVCLFDQAFVAWFTLL